MPMSDSFKERLFPKIPVLATYFGSPFQIDDEQGIRETLQSFQESFVSRGVNFKNFYAVKANPQLEILNIIEEEGGGFDCSSIPELRMARQALAHRKDSAKNIMFTSNNTSQEEFKEARSHGGCVLNLDDKIFIDKIPGRFPKLISFRLNPGHKKTGDEVNEIIGNPVDSKYGVPIEEIVSVYKAARKKGANRFGLHTMICSNDLDYRHMVNTLGLLLEVCVKLNKIGIQPEFVNMGGGIGIPYRTTDKAFNMDVLAEKCKEKLNEFDSLYGFKPDLRMESGRYVTGPHGVLVNRVINVYEKYKNFAGVEVAMPALMRVGMYSSAYHHCTVLDKNGVEKDGKRVKVTIAGPICENCDVLAKDVELPIIEEGDYIVTHDTGAHGTAMGFNYNMRTRPQILLLFADNLGADRICRAETYNDLIMRSMNLNSPTNSLAF